jgi:CheY-like chemotaxis protein
MIMRPRSDPVVLIVHRQGASPVELSQVCERQGCVAVFAPSALDAYGVLAEQFDRIMLVVLDLSGNRDDAFAFRELQLDATRAAAIPAMVITDRPLTDAEQLALRPSGIQLKASAK